MAIWIAKGAFPSFVAFAGQEKTRKIRYLSSFPLWQGVTDTDEFFGFNAHWIVSTRTLIVSWSNIGGFAVGDDEREWTCQEVIDQAAIGRMGQMAQNNCVLILDQNLKIFASGHVGKSYPSAHRNATRTRQRQINFRDREKLGKAPSAKERGRHRGDTQATVCKERR